MKIKPGVELNGVHFMLWYAAAVADWVRNYLGHGEATITGGREPADVVGPRRVRNTFHPGGYALDFRTNDLPGGSLGYAAQRWAQVLQQALGVDFEIVVEQDHIHIEYHAAQRA